MVGAPEQDEAKIAAGSDGRCRRDRSRLVGQDGRLVAGSTPMSARHRQWLPIAVCL
jgi:hypothetical protein